MDIEEDCDLPDPTVTVKNDFSHPKPLGGIDPRSEGGVDYGFAIEIE
jgi:hypothetical protein